MRNKEMKVIYIYGESGTGKTTEAKRLAAKKNYSYVISGSDNDALEGYDGHDCLILDDFRPTNKRIDDVLKMLDNNTSSMVRSRYKNKSLSECKLLIITSILTLNEFWNQLVQGNKTNLHEPQIQFNRRVRTVMKVSKDTIHCLVYDDETNSYVEKFKYQNEVSKQYEKKSLDEQANEIIDMFDIKPIKKKLARKECEEIEWT
ncbi:MAG: hypothetical protein ACU4EQ_03335 [Candidatus Nitrosoglobus sp.]|jgi:adenylate kinase family enzyme